LFDVLGGKTFMSAIPATPAPAYRRFVEMFRAYNKTANASEFGSMSLRAAGVPDDQLGKRGAACGDLEGTYEVFADLPELIGYAPGVWPTFPRAVALAVVQSRQGVVRTEFSTNTINRSVRYMRPFANPSKPQGKETLT